MKRNIILIFVFFITSLYANDMYQIRNNELYDTKNAHITLNQYDHLEMLPKGKSIKYIARIKDSWDYTFYFFDQNGKQIYKFDIGNKYELPWIVFSPNEDFFVLEDGTWIVRSMEVYTFPSLDIIETLTYKRYFFWMDKCLYFNSISKEKIDGYSADDDNFCYLSRFNPCTKEIEDLIKWNECNQYEVKSYKENVIELENKYVNNKADWKDYNKWKVRTININIMDCSFKHAFVNDNLVRFRNEPSLSSEKISSFKKNDPVVILSRTKEISNVGGSNNYWYLVQDDKGIVGYIFGDFISQK